MKAEADGLPRDGSPGMVRPYPMTICRTVFRRSGAVAVFEDARGRVKLRPTYFRPYFPLRALAAFFRRGALAPLRVLAERVREAAAFRL